MNEKIKQADDLEQVTRPIINRLNMGRLFVFNTISSVAVLLITAFLSIFKIHILTPSLQAKAFILFAVFQAVSALFVYSITKGRNTRLFRPALFFYLGVFSLLVYSFAFSSVSRTGALIFLCLLFTSVGTLPILSPKDYLICYGIELIPCIVLSTVHGFIADSYISIVAISLSSFLLSVVSYSATIRKLDLQFSLDSAVFDSETDPLTKLLNSRGLEHKLTDIWPMCIRQNLGVAVLMLDIDNFKTYNDSFGHPMGDECIRKVSSVIRKSVRRRTDYAARIGGDEFVILLTSIDAREAVKWCLELRRAVAEAAIPHSNRNFKPIVSVSMGLACGIADQELTFEQLRAEADKSLYDAKFNGKDVLYYHHKAFGRHAAGAKAINE